MQNADCDLTHAANNILFEHFVSERQHPCIAFDQHQAFQPLPVLCQYSSPKPGQCRGSRVDNDYALETRSQPWKSISTVTASHVDYQ